MDALQTIGANFTPLRVRSIRLYFLGQSVSTVGTWLQVTAYGWVVWQLTQSTVGLGVSAMLYSLPFLIVGPLTSVWADRWDRRKLRIFTQSANMLIAFLLAALALSGSIQVWHVYLFSLMMGIVSALDVPAAQAFLGDIAGVDQVCEVTNLYLLITQLSRVLGPAIGAVVLGSVGAGAAFLLNGLSYVALIYALLHVRTEQVRKPKHEHQSFSMALRVVRRDPHLFDSIVIAVVVTFFGFSILLNMLPAVADLMLGGGASTYGMLMGASGLGALVGIVIVAPLLQRGRRIGVLLSGGAMIGGAALLLLGSTQTISVALVALFVSGLALPAIMTTIMGLLQIHAPETMRARVIAVFLLASYGLQPFAALWIGWLAAVVGMQAAILINAALLILVTAGVMRHTPMRQWRDLRSVPISNAMSAGD